MTSSTSLLLSLTSPVSIDETRERERAMETLNRFKTRHHVLHLEICTDHNANKSLVLEWKFPLILKKKRAKNVIVKHLVLIYIED